MSSGITGGQRLEPHERRNRRITSLRGREGFEQLTAQWDQLLLRMVQVRFFQHPDWYRALFEAALADPEEFLFVTVSDGTDLVGLFPLQMISLCRLGTTINTIGLCNHPHMVLTDCIVDDSVECAWLIPFLLRWLHEARPVAWDVLLLDKVPQRSAFCRLLRAQSKILVVPDITGSSSHLSTQSEETALGAVSGPFKRNLRRLARRAEETAPLRYEVCETLPVLDDAFRHFLNVEASGWKGACGIGTAISQDASLVSFYHGIMRRFGARGQCMINLLRHGEKVVACQFGLLVGGTYSILKIGYSEDHASIAPGNLVMERTIQWCCDRPDVHELSFVTCPAWSHLWKPRQEPVASFRIFNPTIKGRLLHGGLRVKRWCGKWRRCKNDAPEGLAEPLPRGALEESGRDRVGAPTTPSHSTKTGKS